MIVSIDGIQAAGKSTQAQALHKATGIPILPRYAEMSSIQRNILRVAGFRCCPLSNVLGALQIISVIDRTKDYILDVDTWMLLVDVRQADRPNIIRIVGDILATAQISLVSFYLDVPRAMAEKRRRNRAYVYEHRVSPDNFCEFDTSRCSFFKELACAGVIHIIDGTQAPDAVTDAIMTHLTKGEFDATTKHI